jgi:hypothetical protein
VDLDVVGLGQHGHGHGRRVNAPLRFGLRDALDAVDPAFELEAAVHTVPFDDRDDLLDPTDAASDRSGRLDLPPLDSA